MIKIVSIDKDFFTGQRRKRVRYIKAAI